MRVICLVALATLGLALSGCPKAEESSPAPVLPRKAAPDGKVPAPVAAPQGAPQAMPAPPAPGDNSIPAQDFRDGKG
jgi:hypothetical protein